MSWEIGDERGNMGGERWEVTCEGIVDLATTRHAAEMGCPA